MCTHAVARLGTKAGHCVVRTTAPRSTRRNWQDTDLWHDQNTRSKVATENKAKHRRSTEEEIWHTLSPGMKNGLFGHYLAHCKVVYPQSMFQLRPAVKLARNVPALQNKVHNSNNSL